MNAFFRSPSCIRVFLFHSWFRFKRVFWRLFVAVDGYTGWGGEDNGNQTHSTERRPCAAVVFLEWMVGGLVPRRWVCGEFREGSSWQSSQEYCVRCVLFSSNDLFCFVFFIISPPISGLVCFCSSFFLVCIGFSRRTRLRSSTMQYAPGLYEMLTWECWRFGWKSEGGRGATLFGHTSILYYAAALCCALCCVRDMDSRGGVLVEWSRVFSPFLCAQSCWCFCACFVVVLIMCACVSMCFLVPWCRLQLSLSLLSFSFPFICGGGPAYLSRLRFN